MMFFDNPAGLYLLFFVVGLILIYLIKAKPKEITIPSLLFFASDKKVLKYNSILKKLLLKALFFLQLLFILALAFSAANPFIQIPVDAYSLNTVAIIDVSASMTTKDTHLRRIDIGKEELLKQIRGKTSIILAEQNPIVIATNVSTSRARALITNLEAKHVPTRIDSSILLANELLGNDKGTILVYSDFLLHKDDDVLAAMKLAEANDKRVVFVDSGRQQENVGFTVLNINRGKGEAFLKNFGARRSVVDIKLKSQSKQEEKRIEIEPNSLERVTFEIEKGDTTVELVQKDRLSIDDTLYVTNPYESKIHILVITNHEDGNSILHALEANPLFEVEIAKPPVIPELDFDIVVISKVDRGQLLPNTFRDLKDFKDEGGKVIVGAQEGLDSFNFQDLLSFEIGDKVQKESEVCVDIVNDFTADLSNPMCFTSTLLHYKADIADESAVVIASSHENDPIFVLQQNVFYYGIIDSFSGFKEQINYPLFWDKLINFMLGRETLANYNFKTGDIVLLGGNESGKAILDKVGFSELNGKRYAVNLLNDVESNLMQKSLILNETKASENYEKVRLKVNLDQYLLLFAVLLFAIELFYIKRRGDL